MFFLHKNISFVLSFKCLRAICCCGCWHIRDIWLYQGKRYFLPLKLLKFCVKLYKLFSPIFLPHLWNFSVSRRRFFPWFSVLTEKEIHTYNDWKNIFIKKKMRRNIWGLEVFLIIASARIFSGQDTNKKLLKGKKYTQNNKRWQTVLWNPNNYLKIYLFLKYKQYTASVVLDLSWCKILW